MQQQRIRTWSWAGHVARRTDTIWSVGIPDWEPEGFRRQGRPNARWENHIVSYFTETRKPDWRAVAQKLKNGRIRQILFQSALSMHIVMLAMFCLCSRFIYCNLEHCFTKLKRATAKSRWSCVHQCNLTVHATV